MSKHNKYESITDFNSYEELFERLGNKQHKPKIGSLGKALIEASKRYGRSAFLTKMLDAYFNKLRHKQYKKHKKETNNKNAFQKQNSGHPVQSNASDNTTTGSSSSIESNGQSANRQSF